MNLKSLLAIWLCVMGLSAAAQQVSNQLANPSMEGAIDEKTGLPPHWQKFALGVPAEYSVDQNEKHSGQQSIHMIAKETARSYVWSDKIPVAPGEKINASCWIKVKNILPKGTGAAVRIIAQFTDANGSMESVKMVGNADAKKQDWQLVKNEIQVPDNALQMRVQIGYSWCYGEAWLDDASIVPQQALVARPDVGEELSVKTGTIPVTIINRLGEKGNVRVVTALNKAPLRDRHSGEKIQTTKAVTKDEAFADVTLSGEATQKVEVPAKILRPDDEELTVSLYRAGQNKPIFSQLVDVIVPPEIEQMPTVPTHWCIEDGAPSLDCDVNVALLESQLKGAKLTLSFEDPKKTIASQTIDGPAYGRNRFSLKLSALPEMTYRVIATLEIPGEKEALQTNVPFSVIERKFARVTLNERGYPVWAGHTIFPLGIFNGGRFEEQSKAGFTVAHGYNAFNASPVGPSLDNVTKRFMDTADMNGMKTLFLIPRPMVEKGDWDGFRRRIRMFKNHPGLLAWDEEEEVARGNIKPSDLDKICKIIREEDPNHPIMIGDSRDVVTRMAKDRSNFFRNDLMDMGMWWWYPFPLGGKDDDVLLGVEKTKVTELAPPGFLVNYHGPHPLWVGIQGYKHQNQADARFPTPTEYRAQAYLAIIAGGKGLMYYGGAIPGGMTSWDKNEKRNLDQESHWDYVQKLVTELHGMADVFMSADAASPKVEGDNGEVSVRMKQSTNGLVLLAVNRNKKPLDVTFSAPSIKAGNVTVSFENRAVSSSDGGFKDHFAPYEVHVYQLP